MRVGDMGVIPFYCPYCNLLGTKPGMFPPGTWMQWCVTNCLRCGKDAIIPDGHIDELGNLQGFSAVRPLNKQESAQVIDIANYIKN